MKEPEEEPRPSGPKRKALCPTTVEAQRLVRRAENATCWGEGHQSILGSPSTWAWACSGETDVLGGSLPSATIRTLTSLLQAYCLSEHWGQQDRLYNCRFPSKMKMCRPLLTKQEKGASKLINYEALFPSSVVSFSPCAMMVYIHCCASPPRPPGHTLRFANTCVHPTKSGCPSYQNDHCTHVLGGWPPGTLNCSLKAAWCCCLQQRGSPYILNGDASPHPDPHRAEDGSDEWVDAVKGRPGAKEVRGRELSSTTREATAMKSPSISRKSSPHSVQLEKTLHPGEAGRQRQVGLRSGDFECPVHAALFHPTSLQNTHLLMKLLNPLVVQWLRIHMQGRGQEFYPWSRKIPHAMEQLSLCTTTAEPIHPRACAPQQDKPLQWETHVPQGRVAPACHK